jgi:hypothetical protein
MVEFAVGAATLSLLLLGTLALAGYQEVDRRGIVAARDAAWRGSWSTDTTEASARSRALHRDFLADGGVRDPSGRRLLAEESAAHVEVARRQPAGIAGAATDVMLAPLRVVAGFFGSGFDLANGSLLHGTVRVTVGPLAGMPAPFDELELQLQAPYSLLGDAWHAGGPRHVSNRVAGLVPTNRLSALNAIWQPFSVPLGVVEPSLRQLCFGLIEPDRIPEDRLGPGRTPLPGDCP